MQEKRKKYNIIFLEKPGVIGGPGSFQIKLTKSLNQKGISTSIREIKTNKKNIVLVFAGSKRWFFLLKCKLLGIKIVHRLDGLNWQHKVKKSSTISYYIKAEIRQYMVSGIRKIFADHVIYMSKFIQSVWEKKIPIAAKSTLIYNGCEVPDKTNMAIQKPTKFVAVEGSVNGSVAYEILSQFKYEIDVYGDFDKILSKNMPTNICFKGPVSRDHIQMVLPNYIGYLCLETLPACPNSVIEALSHGLPVFGVNNGALSELVGNAGVLVSDSGDPSKLEIKNPSLLNDAALGVIKERELFSHRALLRHKNNFDLDIIVNQYIKVLTNL